MTAVITAPTDITTDPLAAAASAPASGRVTAGDFDLLIALLQGALAAPAPDMLAAEAPTLLTARRAALVPPRAATLSIGASGERLDPLGEDDARQTPPSAAASLLLALMPPQGAVPVPAPLTDGSEGERPIAGPAAAAAGPGREAPVAAGPQSAEPFANESAACVAATAIPTEPEAPPEVQHAVASIAAPDDHLRPLSGRGIHELRARSADGTREMFTGDGMTRTSPDAAPPIERLVPGRDDLPRSHPFPPREGEAAGTSASESGSASSVSTGAAARAEQMTFETVEPARYESPRGDAVDQVVTRLRELRTPGRHEISVRLDPPELGGVRIDARLEGSRLHVQIRAEHAPTSELLTDALPRIRETLAQQGFAPGDVSVHLGLDSSGRHSARDNAPTFTAPRDNEPSAPPRTVPAIARAVAASDGLDVWA